MSASSIRSQLQQKRGQRVSAEKKVADFRKKEAEKRAASSRAATSARTTRSDSTARSKMREAERLDREANAAAKEVARWSGHVASLSKDEASLLAKLAKAEADESRSAEGRRVRAIAAQEREHAQRMAELERNMKSQTVGLHERVSASEREVAALRKPRPEPLRILVLTSTPAGDLRVGREISRIQSAIRAATNRDLVELDLRPAATPSDLLDGLVRFRPHVVHFSGHAAEALVVFEEDVDVDPSEVLVSDTDLARALRAVDEPPMLVVLNACDTAMQAERLVSDQVRVAVGMSDSILDGDAIAFAARFYAALVDGQSVAAAFRLATAGLALIGSAEPDLPSLFENNAGLSEELVLVVAPEV